MMWNLVLCVLLLVHPYHFNANKNPQESKVNLQEIPKRINNENNENKELLENISIWKKKVYEFKRLLQENKHLSDEALLFKSGTINDQFSHSKPRAVRSAVRNLEGTLKKMVLSFKERKKDQEDTHYLLRSKKATTHVEFKPWNFKENSPHGVYQQARKATFENLLMKDHEQMEKKKELRMAQAYLKFAFKEIQKLKERIAEMQDEMQRKETSYQKQKAVYKKKAQDNWLRACVVERTEAKQISEDNFLNRGWPIMQSQRMPQEPRLQHLMLGGPGMNIPPWGADKGACAVCMKNNNLMSPEDKDKGKVKAGFIFFTHFLCDDFHLGPACFGIFWKPIIIAAYLGISAIVIFIWKVILSVKPHVYQVNLQQISEDIDTFKKENAELAEKITVWEQKINKSNKCLQETKHLNDEAHKFKDNIKTFDGTMKAANNIIQGTLSRLHTEKDRNVKTQGLSGDINDQVKNSKMRAMRFAIDNLEERKKDMEETCSSLKSAKAAKEVQYKTLQTKVENLYDICEGHRKAAEEKLSMRRHEREEKEKKLSMARDKVKSDNEEILYLKKKTGEIQEQVQKKEKRLQQQIIFYEQKINDTWLRTCAADRAVAEQIREAAYLKERLAIMQYWRIPKGPRMYPAPRGSGMDNPALKGNPVRRAFPMESSCVIPPEDAGKEKVNMAGKEPPPFPGVPRMPYPKQGHLSSFMCPGPLPPHPPPPCPPQEPPV